MLAAIAGQPVHDVALRTRNILSLCAGVGGLELGIALALDACGEAARGICYVEREAAAAASLVASMEAGWLHPAPVWSDMLTFDPGPWRGVVHILASGDPCQENSVAGKRAGAAGTRFLAPEVCRIAEGCRPDLIVRENVPGNAGEQLAALVPPLERLGYRVAAGIFSSAETGNTMRRERLFILAERQNGDGRVRGGFAAGPAGGDADAAGCGGNVDATGNVAERARRGCRECGQAGGTRCVGHTDGGRAGRSRLLDCAERTEWRPLYVTCGEAGQHLLPPRQEGSAGSGAAGGALGGAGGAESQGQQRGKPDPQGRQVARRPAALPGGTAFPPAVIPGPTDSRWIDVLDRWPELQPALSAEEAQSHLRRGIDALAHRVERLRATGNGVDPVVAAYACLRLGALLAATRAAGAVAVRDAA